MPLKFPDLRFGFQITKFHKLADGRLEVEGLASDETIDSQGDIVDYDGLKRAASSWRGNIREAHDPKKPVGKALEVTFDDEKRAMLVRAFVSKGAPETQAKVEDGTLRSFSVGGSAPTEVRYEKADGKSVRRVLEWQMSELSLVDAPANPNANFELVKADGIATANLADDELVQVNENRLAAKLLDALEKGRKKPGAPAQDVEGQNTGTKPAPQSKPPVDPQAQDVEIAGDQAAEPSREVEGTISIPPSVPVDASAAEDVEGDKPAEGTGQGQSSAPKAPAESVEGTKTGEGTGQGQSSADEPAAEELAAAQTGQGKEPAPSSDKIEDTAEAGGSDTEADMIDGKKKRDPEGTPAAGAKTTGKAADAELAKKDYTAEQRSKMAATGEAMKDGSYPIKTRADLSNAIQSFGRAKNKAAVKAHIKRRAKALGASDSLPASWKSVEALLTKFFYGGEQNDIAAAADILGELAMLYEAEQAEGDGESTQLDLLATAISALQRFVALEGIELASEQAPEEPGLVDSTDVAPPDTSAVARASDAELAKGDAPACMKCGGPMSCQKCMKDADGMAEAARAPFGKGLIGRAFVAAIAHVFKTQAATAGGVFKVNDGDQLAEGIGKGLSVAVEPIEKAVADLKELVGLEVKGVRESIEKLAKTAAVPMPLRTVPAGAFAPVQAPHDNGVSALEEALATTTVPEAQAALRQTIALRKAGTR